MLTGPALVIERHPIKSPATASPEEYHCQWYQLTDRVQYLPGGLYSGKVTYNVCFHDLANGLQTHCFAPAGLDIKGKWTVGGSMADEPTEPSELGLGMPKHGLWLREDVDMKCNVLMIGFVKKTLKKSHATLVARLVQKAHIVEYENDSRSQLSGHRNSNSIYSSADLKPGRSSVAYSDVSSARNSHISQSPQFPQDGFAPMHSPGYPNMDPPYPDPRHSYPAPQQAQMPLAPDRYPPPPRAPPSFVVELPGGTPAAGPVELAATNPPHAYEMPIRPYQ